MATQPRLPGSPVPADGGDRARIPAKSVLTAYAGVVIIAAASLSQYSSLPAAGQDAAVWVTSAAFLAIPAGLVAAAMLRGPFRWRTAPAGRPAGRRPPLLTRVLLALLYPAVAVWAVLATATVLPGAVDGAAYLAGVRSAVWLAPGGRVPSSAGATAKDVLAWLPVTFMDMIIPVAVSFYRPALSRLLASLAAPFRPSRSL
jgi:hypothetical protein